MNITVPVHPSTSGTWELIKKCFQLVHGVFDVPSTNFKISIELLSVASKKSIQRHVLNSMSGYTITIIKMGSCCLLFKQDQQDILLSFKLRTKQLIGLYIGINCDSFTIFLNKLFDDWSNWDITLSVFEHINIYILGYLQFYLLILESL